MLLGSIPWSSGGSEEGRGRRRGTGDCPQAAEGVHDGACRRDPLIRPGRMVVTLEMACNGVLDSSEVQRACRKIHGWPLPRFRKPRLLPLAQEI